MLTRPAATRRRGRRLVAGLAAAVILATTACSGSSDSDGGGTGGKTSLTLSTLTAPLSLDPSQLAEGQQAYLWSSIYDTLFSIDNDGTLNPNAAESWKYSEDARTLTITLRDGMKFSSGDPVNAAAVKATLERTKATPGQQQGKLTRVASIDAPDDRTVVITLSAPDPSLLTNLAYATGVIGDPKTLNDKRTALDPVGSGPYVLDDATVNGTTYVLKKRDDYWNAKAYPFERFTVRVIQDRTAGFNALRAGELDVANVENPQVAQAKAAGFDVRTVKATAVAELVLADRNGTLLKPLADERVRRAINMAFDREKIVKTFLQGSGQASVQLFNPKGVAYDAALDSTYKYDPAAAKKLLAEAGYPNGFAVTMPSTAVSKAFEPLVNQGLADIGITVKWDPVPPQNTASSVASKKYPMIFFIVGLSTSDRELLDNYGPQGFLNPFGTTDAELDALMTKAGTELDPAKSAALYQQINRLTVEKALNAPLFYIGTNWATAKGIEYLGTGANTMTTIRTFAPTA
ncbi:ABC transporter substrate-binding protein [Cryptosporangium aurantiacum]|uniref:Peptide/nickel transport system substrate-binding protein n=1 Tax=Cryptosporangium aurantiacum TaxID=134849 RepID=A0A1M7PCT2_9ACTN|nr:ABC transporter substrate-binding protein [Cryptosporangium aurantiacum]SHN14731.1 peptide/nickel transport system substrate-binding protein [Cryptosporangium aurantiacum]